MKLQETLNKRKELTELLLSKTGRKGDRVSYSYQVEVYLVQIYGIGSTWETGSFDQIKDYINKNAEELKNL